MAVWMAKKLDRVAHDRYDAFVRDPKKFMYVCTICFKDPLKTLDNSFKMGQSSGTGNLSTHLKFHEEAQKVLLVTSNDSTTSQGTSVQETTSKTTSKKSKKTKRLPQPPSDFFARKPASTSTPVNGQRISVDSSITPISNNADKVIYNSKTSCAGKRRGSDPDFSRIVVSLGSIEFPW